MADSASKEGDVFDEDRLCRLIAMMKEAYTDGSLGEIKKFTIALKQFCWR